MQSRWGGSGAVKSHGCVLAHPVSNPPKARSSSEVVSPLRGGISAHADTGVYSSLLTLVAAPLRCRRWWLLLLSLLTLVAAPLT
ncbi:hypothetical protein KI387_024496, partial [Taxus chinensis]